MIARGGQLDGTTAWFHPAASQFSFDWLAKHQQADPQQPRTKQQFSGQERIFEQLDRDHNGSLTGIDLDWSDSNPWVRQSCMVTRIFRRMEADGEGLLTADELNAWFGILSSDGQEIRSEQFREALVPPGSGCSPGDMPSKDVLIKGFLAGETGSLQAGPGLDEATPDFTVRAISGGDTVKLSDSPGKRPLVQVFGNLTCGPSRSMYPTVESVWNRQKEHMDFLFVSVRRLIPWTAGL